jgi:hypothetical protein
MTDRDRLIELLKPHVSGTACLCESGSCELTSCRDCKARRLADHLLVNGVIVLPCKAGDTIWYKEGKYFLDSYTVKVIDISEERTRIYASNISRDVVFNANDFGKSVFLTKEEAEAKLKELGKCDN